MTRWRFGLLVAAIFTAGGSATTSTAALPPDFTDELVASIGGPTAIAFTPDGRMLVTTQSGRLRVIQGGALLTTPALDLGSRVCTNSERGLLGVAVDPAFALNRSVFLYYTANIGTPSAPVCVNRISRFSLSDANVIDPGSELVLVDRIHSTAGNHNAGDIQFGKDGLLYAGVGDGGCDYAGDSGCAGANDAARDRHVLVGRILRIAPDGGIPAGNPFQGTGTARCNVTGQTTSGTICQETFAWGLRNPFRLAFDPNAAGTRFFINDVGQGAWEEVDLGAPGVDYGWNVREGHCRTGSSTDCGAPPAGMTNPVHDYSHATGCRSITGGAFVPAGVWPAEYDGDYVFGDYVCGKIFRLEGSGTGSPTEFAAGLGSSSAVALTFGPHGSTQALYYTTYATGGQVRRISYTGSPLPPPPPPPPGPPPPPPPTPPANTPPRATVAPAGDLRFRAGETVVLSAQATDDEDGAVPPSRLSWRVTRHHGSTHTHPWVADTAGATIEIPTPGPEDLASAATSYLEVELTATDSGGLSTTVRRELRPRLVELRVATQPAGLELTVEGEPVVAPRTFSSWEGWRFALTAPWQLDGRGRPWAFAAWDDGGGAVRSVVTPTESTTYRARFDPAVQIASIRQDPPGPDSPGLNREWIRLRNVGERAVSLRGWTIRDRAGNRYRFGAFTLGSGRVVTLHSGRGRNTASRRYWSRSTEAWQARSDAARLITKSGALVDSCVYGRRGNGFKTC